MTQRIILHGEPAFLKQSPLGWTGVGLIQPRWRKSKEKQSLMVEMHFKATASSAVLLVSGLFAHWRALLQMLKTCLHFPFHPTGKVWGEGSPVTPLVLFPYPGTAVATTLSHLTTSATPTAAWVYQNTGFDDPFRLLSWLFFKIFKMTTIF